MTRRRANLWGLRMLAVFAAVAVWFSTSFVKRERVSEKLIDATVTYNPSRGIIILDPLQTVKVRLRGPDRQIRTLAPHVVDVVIEVSGVASGSSIASRSCARAVWLTDRLPAVMITMTRSPGSSKENILR